MPLSSNSLRNPPQSPVIHFESAAKASAAQALQGIARVALMANAIRERFAVCDVAVLKIFSLAGVRRDGQYRAANQKRFGISRILTLMIITIIIGFMTFYNKAERLIDLP